MKSIFYYLYIFAILIGYGTILADANAGKPLPKDEYLEQYSKHTVKPKNGYIPDAATAIDVGVAVLTPIYGKVLIESEKPFSAELNGGVWTVKGAQPKGPGGVAVVEISRRSGEILRVTHGK